MIRIAMAGACGRMGRAILTLAHQDKNFKVAGALEHKNSPDIGRDMGEVLGIGKLRVPVTASPATAIANADALIDFTHPSALAANLKACTKNKVGYIIGTTGLTKTHMTSIKKTAKSIPVVQSPNMSIGVNLLFRLAEITSKALDEDYDIEILEAHHKMKKDAPSGTAMKLLEVCSDARKKNIAKNTVYGREGEIGARPKGQIGVMTLRGGDVVGDHTVYYMTTGERIELTHRASSRNAFASGALRAAKFVARKKSGLYTMQQVLGIH